MSAREVVGSFRLSPQNEEADDADTGHCGPEAFWALDRGGIRVAVGVTGTVRDALERYQAGQPRLARRANVDKYFGLLDSLEAMLS